MDAKTVISYQIINQCNNIQKRCVRNVNKLQLVRVKSENQQDATNSMFIIKLSISTCFGHHYAHHRENKTVSCCMRCSAWVCRLWFAVVLWSCVVSCVHCVKVTVRLPNFLSQHVSGIIMPITRRIRFL